MQCEISEREIQALHRLVLHYVIVEGVKLEEDSEKPLDERLWSDIMVTGSLLDRLRGLDKSLAPGKMK